MPESQNLRAWNKMVDWCSSQHCDSWTRIPHIATGDHHSTIICNRYIGLNNLKNEGSKSVPI